MFPVLSGVLLGLTSLAWVSYYVYHAGPDVWLVSKTGEYVADLVYPGESDIKSAYKAFTGQPGVPGQPGSLQPPCDLCGDKSALIDPNPRQVQEWIGTDGKVCLARQMPRLDTTNGVIQLFNSPVEAYRAATYARRCASTRPPDRTPGTSLTLGRCTAVAGFQGIPDRKAFTNPKDYIAQRLFGKTIQQLRVMTPEQLHNLAYDKVAFGAGPMYPSWGVGVQHRSTSSNGTGAVGTYRYDYFYAPVYDGDLGQAHPYAVFMPPMLYTVARSMFESTGFSGTSGTGETFLPSQWLVADQPYKGPMSAICDNSSHNRTLAEWANSSQRFAACATLSWADGKQVSVCEYSPSFSWSASLPSPDNDKARGLPDWTDAEARDYIDYYMRFRTMRVIQDGRWQ